MAPKMVSKIKGVKPNKNTEDKKDASKKTKKEQPAAKGKYPESFKNLSKDAIKVIMVLD